MSNKKTHFFRGVRKAAYLSRKVTSKAANFSGRIENKADRIIHGTDPTIMIHEKILQEQVVAEALPEITAIHPALPIPGRAPAVNLLIPSLQKSSFFGGTATALIFAAKLAQEKKVPLRVVETLKHGKAKAEELHLFLAKTGISVDEKSISILDLTGRKYNHYGYLDIHPNDIYIASAWWDAHLLDALPLTKKFIYLIQDYEPIFYNNSDRFVLAESTYKKQSFIPVCNTKLMLDFMIKKGYTHIEKNGLFFEPAVNLSKKIGFSIEKHNNDKKVLFMYGRPSVERNLFYRSIEVINEVFSREYLSRDEWLVYMAGQDKLPDILLDCGVTIKNLGKMSFEVYYDFAKTVDVGLSLMMAPHPSYPPLELSSLGAAVVTTSYKNKQDLSRYSKNIIVTDSTVDQLVNGIEAASRLDYRTRLANAKASGTPSDWHASLSEVSKEVTRKV